MHDGPIFSICVLKDGSIITGGGRDSRIVKFDTLYRKTGMEAQLPEHLGSIRTVSQVSKHKILRDEVHKKCYLKLPDKQN